MGIMDVVNRPWTSDFCWFLRKPFLVSEDYALVESVGGFNPNAPLGGLKEVSCIWVVTPKEQIEVG